MAWAFVGDSVTSYRPEAKATVTWLVPPLQYTCLLQVRGSYLLGPSHPFQEDRQTVVTEPELDIKWARPTCRHPLGTISLDR